MTLEGATLKLIELEKEVAPASGELADLQYAVDVATSDIVLTEAGQKARSELVRESIVTNYLEKKGLKFKYQMAKARFRYLMIRKDLLLEISRNLRETERR